MPNPVRIGWLDPSINSKNTGDQIIADAVRVELAGMLPDAEIIGVPTQTFLTRDERARVKTLDRFIVGGTNLLNGNVPRYIQWRLDPLSIRSYRDRVALMGVGWWQYQKPSNRLSASIWRAVLGSNPHSVRDAYTRERLAAIGIASTNTTCPTMWQLPDSIAFGSTRPTGVVLTVTDYHKNPARDARLIAGLRERYDEVVAWPQGSGDVEYLHSLDPTIQLVGRTLADFNERLDSGRYDYVGTRLHAGVRALQKGVSAVIVAIDNRAREIAADTGLRIISNDLTPADWQVIDARADLELRLPREQIAEWKSSVISWAQR